MQRGIKGKERGGNLNDKTLMEVQMWKCSCCQRELTSIDEIENEIDAEIHFDIERSIKELYIEDDVLEENLIKRNVKMNRILCEKCFNKVLNESPTLKKTFMLDGKILY